MHKEVLGALIDEMGGIRDSYGLSGDRVRVRNAHENPWPKKKGGDSFSISYVYLPLPSHTNSLKHVEPLASANHGAGDLRVPVAFFDALHVVDK